MKRILAAAAAAVLLAACGNAAADTPKASVPSGATTVAATLSDSMKIAVDKTSVAAGTVTFHVTNAGKIVHELVLLKTDLPYDQLPPNPAKPGKVLESSDAGGARITHVGETDDMDGGTTKDFTVTVTPGRYVLVCNEPGHYAAGMRLPFTVQ